MAIDNYFNCQNVAFLDKMKFRQQGCLPTTKSKWCAISLQLRFEMLIKTTNLSDFEFHDSVVFEEFMIKCNPTTLYVRLDGCILLSCNDNNMKA